MLENLCKYKNIFGEPNTGVHKIRIFNIAVIDVVATIILGYGISKLYKKLSFSKILIILFLLGIISHKIFCVRTTIDKLLFP